MVYRTASGDDAGARDRLLSEMRRLTAELEERRGRLEKDPTREAYWRLRMRELELEKRRLVEYRRYHQEKRRLTLALKDLEARNEANPLDAIFRGFERAQALEQRLRELVDFGREPPGPTDEDTTVAELFHKVEVLNAAMEETRAEENQTANPEEIRRLHRRVSGLGLEIDALRRLQAG